jgi:small multidrug resistance family-3 protein
MDAVHWTPALALTTLGIFVLAGFAEIGGGWLIWQTIRNFKPWYFALIGAAVLILYGFIPTLQPKEANFSRVYAVYGGIFIFMAYGWGWAIDGDKPDIGDIVGACIALGGVGTAWFWPR